MTWPREKIFLENEKAHAEAIFSQIAHSGLSLDENKRDNLKHKFRSTFKSYFSRHKISKKWASQIQKLKRIASHNHLYISKFDKGNGILIIDRSLYVNKMQSLLSDSSKFQQYSHSKRSSKDPFILEEDRFVRKLLDLKSKGLISDSIFKTVKPVGSQPARLYGLPKIHKDKNDPPFRPILNMINAYPSRLAKWLDNLLKPLIPKTFTVQDSFEFVNCIKQLSSANSKMVSFDVKSLFTNIPVEDTIDHILSLVPVDFPVGKQALRDLLRLACTNILFSFNDNLYVQKDGMSMGSSLAPTMAAFAMDLIESKLASKSVLPSFYKRYVDDVFCLVDNSVNVNDLLKSLNDVHPSIQFTIEEEKDANLVFLDVAVTRDDNIFHTSWHMKETNTGSYTPFSAYSPKSYRLAAMKSLFSRAFKISSNNVNYQKAALDIQSLFIKNGFSLQTIRRVRRGVEARLLPTAADPLDAQPKIINWSFPFIAEAENNLRSHIKDINKILPATLKIRPVFTTKKTGNFFLNKDKVPADLKSNVVYKYTCEHCGKCYIGSSIRHFVTRQNEHLRGRPVPSEISLHNHPLDKKNFKILAQTKYPRLLETLLIKKAKKHQLLNDRESSTYLLLNL